MTPSKLPTEATAKSRCLEKYPIESMRTVEQTNAYIHGFTDAIALVRDMLRDDALEHRWIPVAEKMPEDGTSVTVWMPEYVGEEVETADVRRGAFDLRDGSRLSRRSVTHWRPLPSAPEREE